MADRIGAAAVVALAMCLAGNTNAQEFKPSPVAQIELRLSLGGALLQMGSPTTFERAYLRFDGEAGVDLKFDNFTISPRVASYGWNSELGVGRERSNELLPYIDLSFGNWIVSAGDVQGRPLPLPEKIATHTVIETRPIYAYYADRQDIDAENAAPIDGFRDNSLTSSGGKLALAYAQDNWFLRGIVDPGIVKDLDLLTGIYVAREYYRLETGAEFTLASGTSLRAGAAIWHQDSYQNTNGRIVDTNTGSKSVRWGNGAIGTEFGIAADMGKFDVGLTITAIQGPYSDAVVSTAPDDMRSAAHLISSYQINEKLSVAGTYSQTLWELTNNPSLGLQTGRLLQVGAEYKINEKIAVGLGYVWSDSSGWSGGAAPKATLSYPVLGVSIAF